MLHHDFVLTVLLHIVMTNTDFYASKPASVGSFDLAVIIGALSVDMVSVRVLRQMCEACKTGKKTNKYKTFEMYVASLSHLRGACPPLQVALL